MTAPAPQPPPARDGRSSGHRPNHPTPWLALALIPPLFILYFIATYAVNARYWDDWWFTPILAHFANGSLTLRELLAQYNESRSFFPRLAMIACAACSHGDTRAQILFTFALAAFASASIYILSRPLIPHRPRRLQFLTIANLCIFSPVQHQTWIWAVQIVVLFPLAWLLLAILVLPKIPHPLARAFTAAAIATAATFSHANGLLLWPLLLPLLQQDRADPTSSPRRSSLAIQHHALYLLCAALIVLAYFHHYTHPAQNPPLRAAFSNPPYTARFFLTLLGAPFAWGFPVHSLELPVAQIIGLFELLLAFATTIALLLRARRDRAILAPARPFLLLLAYTLATAAVTAVGRTGFGLPAALTDRYTTYNLYLPAAVLYLLPLAFPRLRPRAFLPISAVAILLPTLLILPANLAVARSFRAHHLQGKAALHYCLVIPGLPVPGAKLLPDNPDLRTYADALDRAGYLRPPLARYDLITPTAAPPQTGRLESLTPTLTGGLRATGWALLPAAHRPADAVLLAWRDAAGQDHALAVTSDFTPRPDIATALHDDAYRNCGWTITLAPGRLPKTARALTAYAANARTANTYPLANTAAIIPPAP